MDSSNTEIKIYLSKRTYFSFLSSRLINFLKKFFLFMRDAEREREREREAKTQAEGEAGSLWGA